MIDVYATIFRFATLIDFVSINFSISSIEKNLTNFTVEEFDDLRITMKLKHAKIFIWEEKNG